MIGFIIPYYNAPEDLERCKERIKRQFKTGLEVFVHDNSIDNLYFTAAVNIGLKHFLEIGADYICVINQDCFLEDDTIIKMFKLMQSSPDIGIVSPCHLTSEGMNICWDTGGLSVIPSGISISISRTEVEDAPILWASASCWLMRVEMIEEIGLLDENMVHFSSDVDYCYTARAHGWEVWRCAAFAIHKPNSLELSNELIMRRHKDTEYLIKKWCGGLFNELSFSWQKEPLEQDIILYKKGEKINVGC